MESLNVAKQIDFYITPLIHLPYCLTRIDSQEYQMLLFWNIITVYSDLKTYSD